jgi:hypothetical protein
MPSGVPPELDEPGLVRMQLQPKLREPLTKIGEEPQRVVLILETHGEIVGEPYGYHIAARTPIPPPLDHCP